MSTYYAWLIWSLLLLFISLWMQTIQSLNLWLLFSPLQFIQFPWRFAGISIFLIALLGGSSVQLIKSSNLKFIFAAIFGMAILLVQNHYFKPQNLKSNATDKDFIILEDVYLPKEYLPIGVKADPPRKITLPALADNYQEVPITNLVKRSNFYSFSINPEKATEIVVPIYWFPGWRSFRDGQEMTLKKQPKTGLILLSLPPDKQKIVLKFTDTPLRRIGNFVSLFSLIGVCGLSFGWLRRKSSA